MGTDLSEKIAVVTVNWNGWKNTLECLNSLRSSQNVDWHLFIVDNNSSDDSLLRLGNLGDDVSIIASTVNGGWTGGNNLGLEQAIAKGFKKFFLLNNDAQVLPETLVNMLRFQNVFGEDIPIIGPVQMNTDRSSYNFLGATVEDETGIPKGVSVTQVVEGGLEESWKTSFIKGAAIFLDIDHIERVGLFDERFFLNYDEADWCFRARKKGIPLKMMRDAKVIHAESGSIGGMDSPLSTYFLIRNELLFAEMHCTPGQRRARAKQLWYYGKWLAGGGPVWLLSMLFARSPTAIAFRTAVRDYGLRRFGDCPRTIRKIGAR